MNNAPYRISAERAAVRLARSTDFRRGWEDAKHAAAFDYDASSSYERGRHFYVWYQQQNFPRAQWRHGVMARTCQQRLISAIVQRAIR